MDCFGKLIKKRYQSEKKLPKDILKNCKTLLRFIGLWNSYVVIFYLSVMTSFLCIYWVCLNYFTKFTVISINLISVNVEFYTFFKTFHLFRKRYKILELINKFQYDWKKYVVGSSHPETRVVEANNLTESIIIFYAVNMCFWIFATLFYSVYTSLYYGGQLNIVQITFGTNMGMVPLGFLHSMVTLLIVVAIIVVGIVLNSCDCMFVCFCIIIIAQMRSLKEKFDRVGYETKQYNGTSDQGKNNAINTFIMNEEEPTCSHKSFDVSNEICRNWKRISNDKVYINDLMKSHQSILPESVVTAQLSDCVNRHNEIFDNVKILNNIFSSQAFGQYVFTTITLCLLMFHFNYSVNSDVRIVPYAIFSLLTALNLFIFALFGQKIINASSNIATAAYNIPWYNYSPRFVKSVIIVMARSQKPAHIDGLNFYVISMESFAKVISAAASYYTFLKNISSE